MFVEIRDIPLLPTLRLLHRYPYMMPHMQCDKGAIKHIMSGSNVMCPGLTSPGGKMDDV
jgi:PUA domain protein